VHEMSLMESVIEIACETAVKNNATKVTSIHLDVGMLSHVELDALLFCFDAIRCGSIAEDAELKVSRITGEGWCLDCVKTVPLTERFGCCPECGQYHVQMTAGDELKVRELEVI
jgi:hydrogenase nickel incorporation protein HypA/HybF